MKKVFYNVTVVIEDEVHDEWLDWMKETHIPDVMRTGKFLESRICRLHGVDESQGRTYSFQYIAPNMKSYEEYQSQFAKALQQDHIDRYGNKALAYRSLMTVEAEFGV